MTIELFNFDGNDDAKVIDEKGPFRVLEWQRDLSVTRSTAAEEWFASHTGVRRRQLLCDLDGKVGVTLQAGAMQWMAGDIEATTGIKGAGDLAGKLFRGAISQDSAIKPEYRGRGTLVCEPTWHHIVLMDLENWGGEVTLEDGAFLACEADIEESLDRRRNVSSAVAGNEGLFNLKLSGKGAFALECPCPAEELVTVDLRDDVLKVDGNYALAWSSSLEFTVERAGATLVGSSVSGEGLVNAYRGTGRVVLSFMRPATR